MLYPGLLADIHGDGELEFVLLTTEFASVDVTGSALKRLVLQSLLKLFSLEQILSHPEKVN